VKKILGILGGMGPEAAIDFQQKIFALTKADKDCDHIRVILDNNTQIPRRVAVILGLGGENPVPAMQNSVNNLICCGALCIAMPCITAHYFLPRLNIPSHALFLDMPRIAAGACLKHHPGKTIGILSTSGTAKSGIVSSVLEDMGASCITPLYNYQLILDKIIHNIKGRCDIGEILRQLIPIADEMANRGAGCFLLGCTELPLIVKSHNFPYPFVDSTAELAKASITACGYDLSEQ